MGKVNFCSKKNWIESWKRSQRVTLSALDPFGELVHQNCAVITSASMYSSRAHHPLFKRFWSSRKSNLCKVELHPARERLNLNTLKCEKDRDVLRSVQSHHAILFRSVLQNDYITEPCFREDLRRIWKDDERRSSDSSEMKARWNRPRY